MKKCTSCKLEKELSEFNRNKRNKDGHSTECRECAKKYLEEYRLRNKEILTIKNREFKEKNRETINSKNRERYKEKRLNESFMSRKRLANSLYKSNNKGKVNSDTAKRHTSKIKRCCLTTKEDFDIISLLYKEAENLTVTTGINHHVDHIIPLQGKLVSGLHIPSNLQILTEKENCSKHNSFIV